MYWRGGAGAETVCFTSYRVSSIEKVYTNQSWDEDKANSNTATHFTIRAGSGKNTAT